MTKMKVVAFILSMALAPLAFGGGTVVLIKETEARLPVYEGKLEKRALTRGPGITVISPETNLVQSPFKLKINFEPHGGTKINPESVKITYLRTPPVDLTERIASGVTEKGITLPAAEVPAGEHVIRLSVTDSDGRKSSTDLHLQVTK
jgi:hypothetical protein